MLKFAGLWLLVNAGGRLPPRLLYALAWLAGTLAWYASRHVRAVTRDHMRHVLGPTTPRRRLDAAARGCARNAAAYYADFARYARFPSETLFDYVDEARGFEHLFAALDDPRGLILVSAHLGSPEIISQAAQPFGLCLGVVSEPLEPPRLHEYVHRVRQRAGMWYFPADMTGLRQSIAHLRAGGTLGLLIDRDVLGSGRPFPFFGERARMPWGAVEIARRTGAQVVAVWIPRTRLGRYSIIAEPVTLPDPTGDREADVESGMRALVGALEGAIERWPDQWFPLTPVWGAGREL